MLPYLLEIIKDGVDVSLLTFEPNELADEERRMIGEELAAEGIAWRSRRYHKRFSVLATAYDVVTGTQAIRRWIKREKFDILHARVHIPMLMAVLASKLSTTKPKLLFDIRGFFPEEYTDAGIWKRDGGLYRLVKMVERWLMKRADAFVVLTERAREILFPGSTESGCDEQGRPIEVIPCCVDVERFAAISQASADEMRERLGIAKRFVMAYVGSFGGWYMADETAALFGELKKLKENAFALILTQSKPEIIQPLLSAVGYNPTDLWIGQVSSRDIPRYLSAADAAVSFIKPCYSKQASSPTKNAEYLACGLPIIVNDGIGDTTQQITDDHTGVVINEFKSASYVSALAELDDLLADRDAVRARCRVSANNRFGLVGVGGVRYRRIYRSLLDRYDLSC